MFYAITSKRKGCGRTTLALLSSMMVYNKTQGSTLLVDLSSNNDFCSLLNLKTGASIDGLLASITLGLDLDLESNIVHTGGFYLLPGTAIKQPRYLEKRCNDIVQLLKAVETKFNSIILDVDYSLYGDLVDCGLDIVPIHVLGQNILNVAGYYKDIQSQIFEGYYVVNEYEKGVFPSSDLFEKNFQKNSLVFVDRDVSLKTNLNRKNIDIGVIKGSPSFSGVSKIAEIICDNRNIVDREFSDAHKRKSGSFFSRLLGSSPKASKNTNSKRTATKATKGFRQKQVSYEGEE